MGLTEGNGKNFLRRAMLLLDCLPGQSGAENGEAYAKKY